MKMRLGLNPVNVEGKRRANCFGSELGEAVAL